MLELGKQWNFCSIDFWLAGRNPLDPGVMFPRFHLPLEWQISKIIINKEHMRLLSNQVSVTKQFWHLNIVLHFYSENI